MKRRPPRSTRTGTPVPDATRVRSEVELPGDLDVGGGLSAGVGHVDDDVELVTESSDGVDPRGGHRRFVLAGHLDRYQQHHRGKDHGRDAEGDPLSGCALLAHSANRPTAPPIAAGKPRPITLLRRSAGGWTPRWKTHSSSEIGRAPF